MQMPGEGNIFTPNSEPLSDLLAGIHKHHTAMPNFQRPWIWEPPAIYDPLISVAYRYPAGSRAMPTPPDRRPRKGDVMS